MPSARRLARVDVMVQTAAKLKRDVTCLPFMLGSLGRPIDGPGSASWPVALGILVFEDVMSVQLHVPAFVGQLA